MGDIAMRMKSKYNLKTPKDFEAAKEEITQHFLEKKENIQALPPPTIDTNTPHVTQSTPGTTVISYTTSGNCDMILKSLIESEYSSHPQHRSGLWGTCSVTNNRISVALPSQSNATASDVKRLIEDVLQSSLAKWSIQMQREVASKKNQIQKLMDIELRDLEMLKNF